MRDLVGDLGTVIQSDKKGVELLKDPTGWVDQYRRVKK
jgi:hypothetical protein